MASSDSQIDKPQPGRPKRAELPDVNINTGVQSINTEKAPLTMFFSCHVLFCTKHGLLWLSSSSSKGQRSITLSLDKCQKQRELIAK